MPSGFDVVALAASAGGLNALTHVLAALPADFPAAVVVVQHLDPRHRSLMADILGRRTPLKVAQATHGERVQRGTVHVAPPDNHLLVVEGGIPGAPSGYVIVRKAVAAKRVKVAQVEKPKKGKK